MRIKSINTFLLTGSEISYFDNNNLSLPQFRSGVFWRQQKIQNNTLLKRDYLREKINII